MASPFWKIAIRVSSSAFSMGILLPISAASAPSASTHFASGLILVSASSVDKGMPVHSQHEIIPWISPQVKSDASDDRFGLLLPEHSMYWNLEIIGYFMRFSIEKTRGLSTRPWINNWWLSGLISGMPLWCLSKCKPLGVMIPWSFSRGVLEFPAPVVPRVNEIYRWTWFSFADRWP